MALLAPLGHHSFILSFSKHLRVLFRCHVLLYALGMPQEIQENAGNKTRRPVGLHLSCVIPVILTPLLPLSLDWGRDQYISSRESGSRMETLRKMHVFLLLREEQPPSGFF